MDPTYDALSGAHTFHWGEPSQEYTKTALELGYQKYFDVWLSQGILG
jgi:hypothetical protein